MGTLFRVVVYAPDADTARRALNQAFERAVELDSQFSDYRPDSELNRVTQAPGPMSNDLTRVLTLAQQIARDSDGAFDVTAGTLTKLWRRARAARTLPPAQQIRSALRRTGYRQLQIRGHTLRCRRAGLQLDLGGIAKGFAADEMLAILKSHGLSRALVAASGDLALGDPPPDAAGWRVELGATGEVEMLAHCGVSTSGDESQYFVDQGRRYSHLIDPRTGQALVDQPAVTVIAPNATHADALATAFAVLGPRRSSGLQRRYPDAQVRFAVKR